MYIRTGGFAPPVEAVTQKWAYDADGNVIYEAWCAPGTADAAAAHVIAKYTYTAGKRTLQQFALGDVTPNKVWNDRETLTYA